MPPKLTECFFCTGCEAWGDRRTCEDCGEKAQEVCFFCGHNVEACDCESKVVA